MADLPRKDLALPGSAATPEAAADQLEADSRPRILIVCDDAALSTEIVRRLSSVARVVPAHPEDIVAPVRDELPDVLETFALYAARHEAVLAPLVVNEPDERPGTYGPPRRGRKGKLLRW